MFSISPPKNIFIVPDEEFGAGVEPGLNGQMDSMPMQHPILFPVVEFFFNPVADFETVVSSYGGIPGIKEFVDIRSKENAILNPVLATFPKWLYVGCIQGRKSFFFGNRASPIVSIRNNHAKASLA